MLKGITIMAAGVLVAGGAGLAVTSHNGAQKGSALQNVELSANAKAPTSAKNGRAHWGHKGGFGPMGTLMADAAKTLNISTSTLRADMKAGQSLATIAQANGSSAAALESALLADAQTQMQAAVTAGKMTAAQETAITPHLSTMIDQMVTHSGQWMKGGPGGYGMAGHLMAGVAKDLNISTTTLRTDLKDGQSLATIAQANGSSAASLESTLLASAQAKIQSAVSAGKITSAQATSIESHLSTMIDQMVTHSGKMGFGAMGGFGHRGGFGAVGNLMADAAKSLNLSNGTLRKDMKTGQSLAAIAQANGSSASALENTLLADAKAQMQTAVTAGKMTSAQATAMESHLSTMIDQMVTHSGSMKGGPGHWGKAPSTSTAS